MLILKDWAEQLGFPLLGAQVRQGQVFQVSGTKSVTFNN